MEQTILYPFLISDDNRASYLKTLKLAAKQSAKVICFTAVREELNRDKAYLHLLELNGCYQAEINNWAPMKVAVGREIKQGNLENEMTQFLKKHSVDMIICQEQRGIPGAAFFEELLLNQAHQPDLIQVENME